MSPDEIRARLAELFAEVEKLKTFVAAVERGDHDDENSIASAAARLLPPTPEPKGLFGRSKPNPPDTRADQVRSLQRNSLVLQALNRMNKELFPEIQELQFRLANQ
ncbi:MULTISPECIES: hypothetical protein [unclassified Streptomyces]|uniref:hypothetical protein n=1 Tax=unclassified Streptomyces TaxID=2593676 RepID=UPI00225B855D|nr:MULTISPECIES: hypothetical protein [unclassified Streptomyces]MCX5150523.1 hypothetical protein [Streptomyces sp. NBC_00320]WSN47837.1 hypothetical protein OG299_09135 [Streptomyces sp. NBC_01296]WSW62754.1 hypothetical protein OG513_31530 [Streptomyces sp. NBC_00998]